MLRDQPDRLVVVGRSCAFVCCVTTARVKGVYACAVDYANILKANSLYMAGCRNAVVNVVVQKENAILGLIFLYLNGKLIFVYELLRALMKFIYTLSTIIYH